MPVPARRAASGGATRRSRAGAPARRGAGTVLAVTFATLALAPRETAGIEGRYVGTYEVTDLGLAGEDVRRLEQRTDLDSRRTLFPGIDGRLTANLRYSSRPGAEEETDLLRSRLFGEARGSAGRLFANWVPWQDVTPEPTSPRERELNLGGDWRRAPFGSSLAVHWTRHDTEDAVGISTSEDRRADLSRAWSGFRARAGWRRLDVEPAAVRLANPSTTEEWRAAFGADRMWRNVSLTVDTDAILSSFRSAERERDFHAEQIQATSSWRPLRTTTVTGAAQFRRGETEDNALPGARPIDDRSLSLGVQHRPWESLTLDASREYRRRQLAATDETSDYVRLGARFQRMLIPATEFQSGVQRSLELGGDGTEVPRDDAWTSVDSVLRPGVRARLDVRTQNAAVKTASGRLWRYGGLLTLDPTSQTRLDLGWTRENLPRVAEADQREREWSVTGSWSPGSARLVSSLRVRDGEGRIRRKERSWTVTSGWAFARGADLSFDASVRDSEVAGLESEEETWGVNLTARLPRSARLIGSLRRIERSGLPRTLSGTITLDVDFGLGGRS